jgi:hypothetical protein
MIKKNLIENEVEISLDNESDPAELPPWYEQFLKLDEKARKSVMMSALNLLKEAKPETYNFVKKFRCELAGISPRVEYAVMRDNDGDMNVTYVHAYSMPTLLFWCPEGEFHFSVNANLKYNDTVLNKVEGNKIDRNIRGFTG